MVGAGIASLKSLLSFRRALIAALALIALGLAIAIWTAPPAQAWSEQRYVVRVLDGDTIEVAKPGKTSGPVDVIRFAAVNTNETGMCHAAAATQRTKQLVNHKWVTLKADDPDSMASDGVRFLRFVEIDGIDVGLTLIEESLAFALPNDREPSRNMKYMKATKTAVLQGEGMWDTKACGKGPRQNMPLRMVVHWDAHGNDNNPANANTEYARIYNDGDKAVSLDGWSFRDASTHIYSMPSFAKIPAGGYVTVYAGAGASTSKKIYLDHQDESLFNNKVGDAAYLLDPDDDIRVFFTYPCVLTCTDPLKGDLTISANWDAEGPDNNNPNGEWIDIRNVSGKTVKLFDYLLTNGTHHYDFPKGTKIEPGKILRVYVGSGTDTDTKQYWGKSEGVLKNSGDKVTIETWDEIVIAKFKYPCKSDCTDPMQGKVTVTANYDADGVDADNRNGEWVNITNVSGGTIDLAGYVLKSAGYTYYFNSDAIHPGERLRVHIGNGSDTRLKKFWGNSLAILGNGGDEVVLMTLDVRVIAQASWPCSPCGPVPNVKIIDWQWDVPGQDKPNDEWIDIKNKGNTSVDLRDWLLSDNVNHYDFKKSHVLSPGEKVRVYVGSGTDTSSKIYWGLNDDILFNNDLLQLQTPYRDVASCKDWGSLNCSQVATSLSCGGELATLVGTGDDDILVGTSGRDVIVGRAGNDLIDGLGGRDIICGGSGADKLIGGTADDVLKGNGGKDRLLGKWDDDILLGGPGGDKLNGGSGTDKCRSGTKTGCET